MSNPKASAPKVRVAATGVVLNPGDPGYDVALARLRARQEEEREAAFRLEQKKEIEA